MIKLKSIRQTAAMGILSEANLRLRLKQGRLPGVYTGKTFRVNVDALIEMLEAESRKNVVSLE